MFNSHCHLSAVEQQQTNHNMMSIVISVDIFIAEKFEQLSAKAGDQLVPIASVRWQRHSYGLRSIVTKGYSTFISMNSSKPRPGAVSNTKYAATSHGKAARSHVSYDPLFAVNTPQGRRQQSIL